MNNPQQAGNECEPIVPGFETPPSPELSYHNILYIPREEEKREQQRLPLQHLKTCVLNERWRALILILSIPPAPHYFCPIPNGARDRSPTVVIIPSGGGRFPCLAAMNLGWTRDEGMM